MMDDGMTITIQIPEIHVHLHWDNPANLEEAIAKLKELEAERVRKIEQLKTAEDAVKGKTP